MVSLRKDYIDSWMKLIRVVYNTADKKGEVCVSILVSWYGCGCGFGLYEVTGDGGRMMGGGGRGTDDGRWAMGVGWWTRGGTRMNGCARLSDPGGLVFIPIPSGSWL